MLYEVITVARAASGRAFTGARQLAGTLLVVSCLGIVSYHAFGLAPNMATVRETVSYNFV